MPEGFIALLYNYGRFAWCKGCFDFTAAQLRPGAFHIKHVYPQRKKNVTTRQKASFGNALMCSVEFYDR